jgi:hypothetical protein
MIQHITGLKQAEKSISSQRTFRAYPRDQKADEVVLQTEAQGAIALGFGYSEHSEVFDALHSVSDRVCQRD